MGVNTINRNYFFTASFFILVIIFTGCKNSFQPKKGLHLPVSYGDVQGIVVWNYKHPISGDYSTRILNDAEVKQFISYFNTSLTLEVIPIDRNSKAGFPPEDVSVEIKDSETLSINANTKYTISAHSQDTLYILYQPELSRYICKIEGTDYLYNGLTDAL